MPQALGPIPSDQEITERGGPITTYFRLRWQELIDSFTQVPTKTDTGTVSGLTAALATTTLLTTTQGGVYEVGYYIRKTVAGGVSSSLTVTIGWTENAIALTRVFTALTLDSTVANQSDTIPILVDANADITLAVAYASDVADTMTWRYRATVKQLA